MYFGKEVKIFLKGDAKESYDLLQERKEKDKEARSILNSFERVKELLKQNPQYGEPVAKRLIPGSLLKLGVQNLYRVELSNYWKILYSFEGKQIDIFVFVLNIVDHKDYNKIFGYKQN